jgi:HK97 gp10 family phage protein
MSGIRVISNKVPKVREAMEKELDDSLRNAGDDLVDYYRATVWKRLGFIADSVDWHDTGDWKIQVTVGWVGGEGFYSGFQEFGTVHQGARPVVRPGAFTFEPIFARYVEDALKRASRV